MKNTQKTGNNESWEEGSLLIPGRPIRLPAEQRPILLVVVDTEEEFDWLKPLNRNNTSVRAMRSIGRFQGICDRYGIRPTYAANYPVVTQPDGIEPLREIFDNKRAVLAAHVHPWVNPPHTEEVCEKNSFSGNLPYELEKEKLLLLLNAQEKAFGIRPKAYKAGRYGVGPNTVDILHELGINIDLSVCPPMDYRPGHGPDFSCHPAEPVWIEAKTRILEIPITGAYIGFMHSLGHPFYRLLTARSLQWAHLPGIAARLRAFDRLLLSPEGYTSAEHRYLTQTLYHRGVRTFTFSLHSPSVVPGCTPYVRSKAELQKFFDTCQRYFDFFFNEMNGITMTPYELKLHLEALK